MVGSLCPLLKNPKIIVVVTVVTVVTVVGPWGGCC